MRDNRLPWRILCSRSLFRVAQISNLAQKKPGLRYLKVRLQGTASNRDAIGAKVQVKAGGKTYTQWNDGKSGYLSQSSELPLYFGLGSAAKVDAVEVTWPSGRKQTVTGPKVNGQIQVVEEQAAK